MQNLFGRVKEFKPDKKTRIILVATGVVFIVLISVFTVLIGNYKEDSFPVSRKGIETKNTDTQAVTALEPELMQPVVQEQALQENEKKEPLPGAPAEDEVPSLIETEAETRQQGPLLY